jgi:pilus assembly protein CpaB
MRACAVRVNEIVGVAGFVVPGMRVDVLISGTPPGAQASGPQVKTILQNIEVLSAGQNYQKDNEGKPVAVTVVNLLVNPEQAELLSLASNETRIQLVLRNPLDVQQAQLNGSAMTSLFGGVKAPAAPAPRVRPVSAKKAAPKAAPTVPAVIELPPYQIEVFNGGKRSDAKFARPAEEKQ